MKAAVAKQPVSVQVDGGSYAFSTYRSGIIDDPDLCPPYINHAVLAVGYGIENGQEYWLVKNSWGKSWGEDGFVRIAITSGDGVCGIQKYNPTYPTTADQ